MIVNVRAMLESTSRVVAADVRMGREPDVKTMVFDAETPSTLVAVTVNGTLSRYGPPMVNENVICVSSEEARAGLPPPVYDHVMGPVDSGCIVCARLNVW